MEFRTDGSKGVQESGSNDVTENGTVDRITEHGTITSISVSVIQHPAWFGPSRAHTLSS